MNAGARVLALALAAGALTAGCQTSAAPGGFEDDLGDGDASPPDLPRDECDPRRFDDCDSGFKCSYVLGGEFGPLNRCVEILGQGLAGEACEQLGDSDDCANHHICWAMDDEGLGGVCVSHCSPSLACDDPLATCSVTSGGQLSLCLPECDPLVQDCAEGWGCYPDDYKRWACDRDRSGSTGAHGQACDCLNCCDPGLACLPGGLVGAEGCRAEGSAGCCALICMLDDGEQVEGVCPSEDERCEPFYGSSSVLMGYEDVGLCQL